jgi:hypothetical protein
MVKFIMREQGLDRRHAEDIMASYQTAVMRENMQEASDAAKRRQSNRTEAARRAFDHFSPWAPRTIGSGPFARESTYSQDKEYRDSIMWDNDDVKAMLAYYDAGLSIEEAIEQVEEDKK